MKTYIGPYVREELESTDRIPAEILPKVAEAERRRDRNHFWKAVLVWLSIVAIEAAAIVWAMKRWGI